MPSQPLHARTARQQKRLAEASGVAVGSPPHPARLGVFRRRQARAVFRQECRRPQGGACTAGRSAKTCDFGSRFRGRRVRKCNVGGGRRKKMRTTLRRRTAGLPSRQESPVEQPEAADPSVRSAALPALHGRGAESRSGTSSPIVGTITSATPDCAARRAFSSGSSHGWRASAYFEWWTVNTRAAPSSRAARSR